MDMAAYPDKNNNFVLERNLLEPGRNCWRIERAQRFSLLIDAAPYFRAVRAAIRNAKHSVFILSWDIDSRTRLVPEGADDGYSEALGDFLHEIVSSRPDLHVYILNWDFAMLYALEREWLPSYKLGWSTHNRLEFWMDGRHPVGASHHQKVVVIDDSVAFVGGLDLTRCRWDTSDHACHTPLRCDPDGKPHAPFHDVQAMVDGDVARALGMLARTRWQLATGKIPVGYHSESNHDVWPHEVTPDLTDIDIAISRTEPVFGNQPGIHEVRQLYLDAIAAARQFLFFENQYFTSGLIADALSTRLSEPNGPEVMVVSPRTQSGWLEQVTMGVLRARVHRCLQAADKYNRYGLYCPYIEGLKESCLNVHSKVFSMDNDLFVIGSANLSNRSMAFDTECNLAIEASGSAEEKARIGGAIASMRNRLLAEHLATTPEIVQQETSQCRNSLHCMVRNLQEPGRTLHFLDPTTTPELDAFIPDYALIDPEKPIEPDEFVEQFVPKEMTKHAPARLLGIGTLALALILLAIAWRWSPLREWANLASLVSFAHHLEDLPFTPIAIIICYAIAGVLMVPITLLIAVTGIVFGPVLGSMYALSGALLSAAVTYGLGYWLGRDTVRRLLGARVNQLSERVARRGIIAMIIVRMLPVAPYTVVNVVAGASHIRFRDYLIGTLLGMAPGTIITVTFVHHLAEVVRRPSLATISVLALVVILLIVLAKSLQHLLTKKKDNGVQ
jgi:phospholipase D1/2